VKEEKSELKDEEERKRGSQEETERERKFPREFILSRCLSGTSIRSIDRNHASRTRREDESVSRACRRQGRLRFIDWSFLATLIRQTWRTTCLVNLLMLAKTLSADSDWPSMVKPGG